jgi:glycogen debranching enzyme
MLSLLPGNRKSLLKDIRDRASFLAGNLESDFFHNGFFIDRFFWKQAVPVRTANALVPILCGFRRHAGEVLDAVESEAFTSGRGIRTRSSDESDFDPGGYHTGATWSLTTSWASAAEFLAGRPERGWKYLSMLLDDIERDALGCIGECWNSKSLELSGCSLQLWGSGFVPRLVDEFMLGIRVNSPERTISVSPLLPSGVSRIERLRSTGHGPVRLRFRKKGKTFQASCSGSRFRLITGEPER